MTAVQFDGGHKNTHFYYLLYLQHVGSIIFMYLFLIQAHKCIIFMQCLASVCK